MTEPTTQNPTSQPLDSTSVLRVLAHTSLRIADGETIDLNWLIAQLNSSAPSDNPATSSPIGMLLTVPEASDRLRISRWSVYDLIHKRELLSVKIGRRRFIPAIELSRYVDSLPLIGGQLV